MGKGTVLKNDILKYAFQATAPGWAPNSYLYVALHMADPGDSGTQNISEASYTGYTRVEVVRSSAGFTIVGNLVSNTENITFPVCTGAPQTITHWSIGILSTGAGQILYSGSFASSLDVIINTIPCILAGDVDVNDN